VKATIAINNYNYGKFLIECINSVLKQSYKNIEIIIIDDGSTDNSLEILQSHYSDNSLIKIVSKRNGGQLSAFNESIKHTTGDLVCFLDADDIYKHNYIETIVQIYKNNSDVDFVFCAIELFFEDEKKEIVQKSVNDVTIGYSLSSCLYTKEWVGSVTSAVSMKTKLLKKFLPISYEGDWITRADDCLVWGSSIFGAKKYYCSSPLILYRVHKNNNFHGKEFSNDYLYAREITINKLFKYLIDKAGIDSGNIVNMAILEFKSREDKDINLLFRYFKILYFDDSILRKIKRMIELLLIYIKDLKK